MAVSIEKEVWFWDQVEKGLCAPDDWEDFADMFGGECLVPYTLQDFIDFVS